MQQPKIKYHTVRDNILQKQTKTATNLDLNQVSVLEQGLTNIQNSWILIAKNSISSHNLVWLWQQSSEGSLYFSCPNVEEMKMQLYEQNTWILFRMCTSEETLPPFLPPSLSSFFLPSQSWLVSSEELLLIHKSKKQRHLEKKIQPWLSPIFGCSQNYPGSFVKTNKNKTGKYQRVPGPTEPAGLEGRHYYTALEPCCKA